MLDVPALALALTALVVFFRASDRDSFGLAVLAGLVAGLAMQTKYTGLLAPVVLLLAGVLERRPRLGLVAAVVAVLLFASWEAFLVMKYGESHFLHHLGAQPGTLAQKRALLLPFLLILGGVAPAGTLLALTALRVPRGIVVGFGLLLLLGYALLAVLPESWANVLSDPQTHAERLSLRHLLFGLSGGVGVGAVGVVAGRLGGSRPALALRRHDWFLIGWLLLEVAGAVALSPFPAVRRVMGVVVVATLLAGRLAACSCRSRDRRRLVWGLTAGGVVLGLLFYAVDLQDARAEKQLAEEAADWVRERGGAGCFLGHWGFQYYAEHQGLQPIDPGHTPLHTGDWLLVPDARHLQQRLDLAGAPLELVRVLTAPARIPLRTVDCFYDGRTPFEHEEGPCFTVRIFRVTADYVPE